MDVIINNATPAQVTAQPAQTYAPIQGVPYGYGPQAYQQYQDRDGPGFGFFALLGLGIFLFAKARRKRQMWRHRMGRNGMGMGGPQQALAGADWGKPDMDKSEMADEWRENFRRGKQKFFSDGALSIARERYAKGEINADEYQSLTKTLMGEGGAADKATDKPADAKADADKLI
ncbi:hypothetical protein E7T06_14760 [Deinococcus sp. Arct2-2]|uniref:hypothetical protein n=1 Tax=Deinococcus sp. Arct2-2 TaxID=2568653 RepID=UPI0010A45B42|nr:hypothetical protein [Deinococcus sp. Arct2-2]THF68820.1 hypothetical protein E7T06_14760 [Deinococcus sp. Arct2-2]